jgi:hypothetical protein
MKTNIDSETMDEMVLAAWAVVDSRLDNLVVQVAEAVNTGYIYTTEMLAGESAQYTNAYITDAEPYRVIPLYTYLRVGE